MKQFLICVLILIVFINVDLYSQQLHKTGLLFEDISKNPSLRKMESQGTSFKLASSIDNSEHLPPVGNQGQQNSCVAWAVGYYYKTHQEWQEHGWSVETQNHIFSPSFIYNHINGGVDGGAYFADALKLLADNGCSTIDDFPSQSDYTLWPSESVYLNAMNYRTLESYFIAINDMTGIEQAKQHLANGNIAVLGIYVYGNFDDINNYNNTYCVKDRTGNNRGGHAVTIVGYDDNKATADGNGAFRIVNQWGTSWGENGFCWMSYQATMDTLLSQRFICYASDRIQYEPDMIASTEITHTDRNLLKLTYGIGPDDAPIYSKSYFDFYMNTVRNFPARPFPATKVNLDITDGLQYLDTVQSNNVFLKLQSTVPGTANSFSITDLRVPYITESTDIPQLIPGNNESIFVNIDLQIVKESNIICRDITLLEGWNLLSAPVITEDMSSGILFPDANSPVYGYTDKYNVITTLENGKGYWVKYPSSATVNLCGHIVNSKSIPITEGWNLIGVYENNLLADKITTEPWGIISSPFYGYSNKYEVAAGLEAGKSYWVRSSEAGVIDISEATAKEINQKTIYDNSDPKWIKIIVEDNKGDQSIVYGSDETINFDSYALPPIPPGGIFDVRWNSNNLVDNIDIKPGYIKISSAEYPITLKIIGGNANVTDIVGGIIINTTANDGQSLVINNPGIESLQIKLINYPIRFSLSQNYPNPFNPSTNISYSIPALPTGQAGFQNPSQGGTFVTLKLYDILGKEVATLVNEEKTAGNYNVEFNAEKYSLPSGIYFYRLQAESFVGTKKLVLIK